MLIEGALINVCTRLTQVEDPVWMTRSKMLDRLYNKHYRETKAVPVSVDTAEEVEGLGAEVRYYEDAGWKFKGLWGNDDEGAYLSFYKLIPWSEEQIQEAKDWLEANPLIIKEDKSEST